MGGAIYSFFAQYPWAAFECFVLLTVLRGNSPQPCPSLHIFPAPLHVVLPTVPSKMRNST